jgi:hypothetical protein
MNTPKYRNSLTIHWSQFRTSLTTILRSSNNIQYPWYKLYNFIQEKGITWKQRTKINLRKLIWQQDTTNENAVMLKGSRSYLNAIQDKCSPCTTIVVCRQRYISLQTNLWTFNPHNFYGNIYKPFLPLFHYKMSVKNTLFQTLSNTHSLIEWNQCGFHNLKIGPT